MRRFLPYDRQFKQGSWVARLRGQMHWQLGDKETALACLCQAVEKDEDSDNLLALAHFYLEQDDLQSAQEYVERTLSKAPKSAICLLSQAVVLWQAGQIVEAKEKLAQARRQNRNIVRAKDLQYEHFWREKAIGALEAMLAAERESKA